MTAPKKVTQVAIMPAKPADMESFARIHFSAMDDGLGSRITNPPMAQDPSAKAGFAAWSARQLETNPHARFWKAVARVEVNGEAEGKQRPQVEQERGEEEYGEDWTAVGFAKWLVWVEGHTPEGVEATFRLPAPPPTASQPAWDDIFGYVMESRREFIGTQPFARKSAPCFGKRY
jgi:hypothetical protein